MALPGMAAYSCSTVTRCSWLLAWWWSTVLVSMRSAWRTCCGPGLDGAEQSLCRAGLCHCWVQGCGSWVGWSVFGPRCHLEEEVVRMGACEKGSFTDTLGQGLSNFFCKGPGNIYLRLCTPCDLCCSYSALLLYCESSHRQHENTCMAVFQ